MSRPQRRRRGAVGLAVDRAIAALTMAIVFGSLTLWVAPAGARSASSEVRGESAEVNGIRLNYRVSGGGPPLLLLHGFTATGAWWDSLLGDFDTAYTTIVPDLPGHGHSEGRDGPYRYAAAAEDLLALLDHLEIETFRAIGFSAGGAVLLHMAAKRPERIEAMVLVGAAHDYPDGAAQTLRDFPAFEDNPLELQEYWLGQHPGGRDQVETLIEALRGLAAAGNMVGRDALAEIPTRTLAVVGDRDGFVPLEIVVEMVQRLPAATLWVVPGHGHPVVWPAWGGSPTAREIFPEVVRRFLADPEGAER